MEVLGTKLMPSVALCAGIMVLLSGCEQQEQSTNSKSAQASRSPSFDLVSEIENSPTKWLTTGQNYYEQRFSPLTKINKSTVRDLSLAWYHDLDTGRGQEATPIVVGDRMYTTSAWSKVQAFNAVTGELLWQYDPEVPGAWAARGCCDVVNRGVAYWDGMLFVGSFDGRLIALDADTGSVKWTTDTIIDRDKNYTITGAPRVVKGKVLIGNGGAEYGVRGYVSAYDAYSGDLSWRFFTVPGDPSKPFENSVLEDAAKTWNGRWWEVGGGGTVWDSMAYDPDLDMLYIGVGNGSPWNIAERSAGEGDNLFLSSIVAIKPDTGDYVWHFQTTPGDQWDFTATQHMILADLEIEGAARKVIMQAPKNGFFYVLDRETGEFISGEAFVPTTWASGLDAETGRPNINPEAFYHKTGEPFFGSPGPLGGHSWHPMAYSKNTGLVYIPAQELPFPYIQDPNFEMKRLAVNLGVDLNAASLPSDPKIRKEIRKTLTGRLMAWDPVTQKEVWRVDHGGPWNGGVLATAGDLVFQGNRNQEFAAYDATTGDKLWHTNIQTGAVAAPISFEVAGEQYIAIVAGWGGIVPLLMGELAHNEDGPVENRSRVLVYKLNGESQLPPLYPREALDINPPEQFGTEDMIIAGKATYARYCGACHGDTVVSGGVLPDLRASVVPTEKDIWDQVVREGILAERGMISFAPELSEEETDALRAYIIHRAIETKDLSQSK